MDEQLALAAESPPATGAGNAGTQDGSPTTERQVHILVAVSDSRLRRLISHHCQKAHYAVIPEIDGAAALESLTKTEIDIIVSDLFMNDMSGFELLERLNRNTELADIPFLLISNRSNQEWTVPINVFRWSTEVPIRWVLRKPFYPKFMLNVLAKMLRPDDPAVESAEDWEPHRVETLLRVN